MNRDWLNTHIRPNGTRRFQPGVITLQDGNRLMEKVASDFLGLCGDVLKNKNRVTVVFGGGRTPKSMNHHIVSLFPNYNIDWKRVFVFFSDDRCVPPDHIDSNYRMIQETLLCFVGIPESNIYRIQGEYGPEVASLLYEKKLRQFFGNVSLPTFDLAVLGIGTDGHTASLFPNRMSLHEQQKLVVPAGQGPEGNERVTMSYPVLNRSNNIWFLIAGEKKKNILRKLLFGDLEPIFCPAQGIRPENGNLVYYTDQNLI